MGKFVINKENEEWIESRISMESHGYLIKMSTLKWLIEKYVNEKTNNLSNTDILWIKDQLDDTAGYLVPLSTITQIINRFIQSTSTFNQ